MQVKIFTGYGDEGIKNMEKEINVWIHKHEVFNTQTTMCTLADCTDDERYLYMAVTIWHDNKD